MHPLAPYRLPSLANAGAPLWGEMHPQTGVMQVRLQG